MAEVVKSRHQVADPELSPGIAGRDEATEPPLIELAGVEKSYRMGRVDYPALRGIDLRIGAGEIGGGGRSIGQRQDDHLQSGRRDRSAIGGDGDGRRPADRLDE